MEERLSEVNAISNDSQHRLGETSEVLKGLEDKLKASEVSFVYNEGLTGLSSYKLEQILKQNLFYNYS